MPAPAEAPPGVSQKGETTPLSRLLQFHRSKVSRRIYRQLPRASRSDASLPVKTDAAAVALVAARRSKVSLRERACVDEVTAHVCAHGTGSPLGSWFAPTAARSCVTPRSLASKARTRLEAESSRRRLGPQLVQVMWVNIQARSGPGGFFVTADVG